MRLPTGRLDKNKSVCERRLAGTGATEQTTHPGRGRLSFSSNSDAAIDKRSVRSVRARRVNVPSRRVHCFVMRSRRALVFRQFSARRRRRLLLFSSLHRWWITRRHYCGGERGRGELYLLTLFIVALCPSTPAGPILFVPRFHSLFISLRVHQLPLLSISFYSSRCSILLSQSLQGQLLLKELKKKIETRVRAIFLSGGLSCCSNLWLV